MPLFTLVLLVTQAPDTARKDSVTVLAPVVVDAARSARNPYGIPLALSRIERNGFAATGGRGIDEALALVPGVLAQSRAGGTDVRITIRGFGARGAGDRSNAGTTRGIRILLDGFPETEPDGRTALDDIDLASTHAIEIVRSNASAIWGNAAGGVINVSSVPPHGNRMLESEVATGTYGLMRGVVRGSLLAAGGQLAFTLVRSTFDGWRVHSQGVRTLANLAYRTDPDEPTRLGLYTVASENFYEIPGPLTAAQVQANERQANATYLARAERRHNRVGRVGVTLAHDASGHVTVDGLFYVQPKFLQRSERGTFRDFTRYHLGGQSGVRIATRFGDKVTGALRAGFDAAYQDGAILFYSLSAGGNRGDTLRNNQREGARNLGAYLQQELEIGGLGLTVGARYDDITYIAEDFFNPALADRKSFTRLSPKLGLSYRFAPTHMLFAAVGGGIEAPAGNETDPASTFGQDTVTLLNPLLDAIRSTTYEVGTRHAITGTGWLQSVQYDVALYRTAVRDEIIPYRGGRFYFSAGRVRRQGMEVGAGVTTSAGLAVQGMVSYAHHRYQEYVVDSVHYGVPGATASFAGNRVVGVPAVSYAVSFAAAPAFAGPMRARVTVQGTSSYFADDANVVKVDGYKIVNATLALDEPLRLGAIGLRGYVTVNNVFDRPYIASAFLNPDVVGGEPVAFEPGLPRNVVVGMSVGVLP
jgi:iron complex outermembrane receptor protein